MGGAATVGAVTSGVVGAEETPGLAVGELLVVSDERGLNAPLESVLAPEPPEIVPKVPVLTCAWTAGEAGATKSESALRKKV